MKPLTMIEEKMKCVDARESSGTLFAAIELMIIEKEMNAIMEGIK